MSFDGNHNLLVYLEKLPELYSDIASLKTEIARLKENTIPCKPFYEVKELANLMGVHRNTIYNRIKDGEIPAENHLGRHKIPHKFVAELGLFCT